MVQCVKGIDPPSLCPTAPEIHSQTALARQNFGIAIIALTLKFYMNVTNHSIDFFFFSF
jgi:hypothetical protein